MGSLWICLQTPTFWILSGFACRNLLCGFTLELSADTYSLGTQIDLCAEIYFLGSLWICLSTLTFWDSMDLSADTKILEYGYFTCSKYCKCSKILNTSYLPKKLRQTVQTKIRLLLKKQSDQGLPCLLF